MFQIFNLGETERNNVIRPNSTGSIQLAFNFILKRLIKYPLLLFIIRVEIMITHFSPPELFELLFARKLSKDLYLQFLPEQKWKK